MHNHLVVFKRMVANRETTQCSCPRSEERARLVGDHIKETVTQITSSCSHIILNAVSESTAVLHCSFLGGFCLILMREGTCCA